ncbi:MAG TPA: VWA domain-containing protein [Anaeromyxobacter sp.]|nr:VWA domain-containing protein [Anaeromyxobacter sp.]
MTFRDLAAALARASDLRLHLARPWALVLLAAIPLAVAALCLEHRRAPRLSHPRAATLRRTAPGWVARLWWLPRGLSLVALALLSVALARPRSLEREALPTSVEGIDIVIAFDLSTSMRAADFQPEDRIHVAREVLKDFIGRRRTDRIGLVVFALDAYTACPLTLDHALLTGLVDGLRAGAIEDGTAIGNAVATAVNRLRESDARSKAVVLITDGDNNAGQISPLEAARLARALGIRVFPILVGKGGLVPYPVGTDLFGQPVYQPREYPVNPELLMSIARATGGTYASATDRSSLEHGLEEVLDKMEKTRLVEMGGTSRERELFGELLRPAFWLAAIGMALAATRWRSFP